MDRKFGGTLDMRATIGLLTRNIKIFGEMKTNPNNKNSYTEENWGG